ncbi:uncharacterized protein LOC123532929 [Mercenaria mercenaria]|uniref:uncharacterized protein LOC123532929 n=1 Tax=Mercenaria mercenaria TaxID=6596 RepID=UPI00234EBCDA|nr:uncharacterized protein LOC123532929 [Mercenaria mercenaria]
MKQVPLMYVLMSRRRKQDYVAILQKVLDILEEAPAVECFTMDFEIALWQALREVFPSSKLKGCAFHWSQAVQKHVGEFGLARTYRERQVAPKTEHKGRQREGQDLPPSGDPPCRI